MKKRTAKRIITVGTATLLITTAIYISRLTSAVKRLTFRPEGASLANLISEEPKVNFKIAVGNSSDIDFQINSIDAFVYMTIGNKEYKIGSVKRFDINTNISKRASTTVSIPFVFDIQTLLSVGLDYRQVFAQLASLELPKTRLRGTIVTNSLATDIDITF